MDYEELAQRAETEEYPPIAFTIEGKEHVAVYPDTLPWVKQSVYDHAVINFDRLRLKVANDAPFTEDEAEAFGKHLSTILDIILPSVPRAVRKRMNPGQQRTVVVSFLELTDRRSRTVVLRTVLSTLRLMSATVSSPGSAPHSD